MYRRNADKKGISHDAIFVQQKRLQSAERTPSIRVIEERRSRNGDRKGSGVNSFKLATLQTSLSHRLLTLAALMISLLSASGCVKISGSLTKIGLNDFLKTEFIASAPAPADGVSSVLVGLQLKNSDNSAVPAYRPEFESVSGGSIINPGCTTSDKNGISACMVKSIEPGVKTLVLTNAKVGLKQSVTFTAPTGARSIILSSGSTVPATTSAGSKLTISFGKAFKASRQVTSGGYVVKMGLQPAGSGR